MLVSAIITDEGSCSAAETFDFNPSSTWLVLSSNVGSYVYGTIHKRIQDHNTCASPTANARYTVDALGLIRQESYCGDTK